jgi:hypothetical protein
MSLFSSNIQIKNAANTAATKSRPSTIKVDYRVHFSAVFAVKSVLSLYAFHRKNGLITSSQSFFLNLIDGSLRTCERQAVKKVPQLQHFRRIFNSPLRI